MKLQSLLLPLAALLGLSTSALASSGGGVHLSGPSSAELGQPVEITLTNNSYYNARLSSSCLIKTVRDAYGSVVFAPNCLQSLRYIAPFDSFTDSWNQRNLYGQQVPVGTYFIDVSFSDAWGMKNETLMVQIQQAAPVGHVQLDAPSEVQEGELIELTLTNSTNRPVTLSSSCLLRSVRNQHGTRVFSPFCLQALSEIAPHETRSSSWNQRDDYGQQVPAGTYFLDVSFSDAWGLQNRTLTVTIKNRNESVHSSEELSVGDHNIGATVRSTAQAEVLRQGSYYSVEARGTASADVNLFGAAQRVLEIDAMSSLEAGFPAPIGRMSNILRVAGHAFYAPNSQRTELMVEPQYDTQEGDFGFHYGFSFVEVWVDLTAGISGSAHVTTSLPAFENQARTTIDLDAKLHVSVDARFSPYSYSGGLELGVTNTGTVLDLALDMDIVADLEDGISGRHDLRLNPGAMTLEIVVREWRWGWYLIELARKTISHWSSPLMQRANLL